MKQIPLSQGKFALVDDEDFETVNRWKWFYCVTKGGKPYVVRGSSPRYLHRVIMDAQPGERIDHISGDTLDNRRSNLRRCTQSQNVANSRLSKDNIHGFKGITYSNDHGRRRRWHARITHNYKKIYLGRFETKEEAAKAYNAKALELFGPFARLNDL